MQVTRVEQPSVWQKQFARFSEEQMALLQATAEAKPAHAPV